MAHFYTIGMSHIWYIPNMGCIINPDKYQVAHAFNRFPRQHDMADEIAARIAALDAERAELVRKQRALKIEELKTSLEPVRCYKVWRVCALQHGTLPHHFISLSQAKTFCDSVERIDMIYVAEDDVGSLSFPTITAPVPTSRI